MPEHFFPIRWFFATQYITDPSVKSSFLNSKIKQRPWPYSGGGGQRWKFPHSQILRGSCTPPPLNFKEGKKNGEKEKKVERKKGKRGENWQKYSGVGEFGGHVGIIYDLRAKIILPPPILILPPPPSLISEYAPDKGLTKF